MRTLDAVLRQGLERANPVTCDMVEITVPDSQLVLRRANDQFFSGPTPRVSETPGGSTAADITGGLSLTPTNTEIASHYTLNSEYAIGAADPSKQIKGMGWTMDPAYGRVVLKKFTAKIERVIANPAEGFHLQIFRPKVQKMFVRNPFTGAIGEVWVTTFLELLAEPMFLPYPAPGGWDGSGRTDLVFDFSAIRPELSPGPISDDPVPTGVAQNPMYIFAINPVRPFNSNGLRWKTDTTTPILQAGIGTFQQVDYQFQASKFGGAGGWPAAPITQNFSEAFKLEIEQYPATAQLVYVITLPSVPIAASTLRAVFERSLPAGTSATLELSTAGSGGPWTAIKHGDVIATKQLTYHLRVTLNASASGRQAPRMTAVGLEARVPIDVSAEATVEAVPHEIQLPFCQAGIGEGRVSIVRTGRRDFRDPGSELAVGYPASKLELDHYIGSRHPKIPRDRWLLYERAAVTNREPTEGTETFSVLSPLKALKKRVPQRIETINTVHTVVSATTGQVVVTPNITGATNDYMGKGYYLRVRSSTQLGVSSGFIQTIDTNTAPNILVFTTALPGTLIAGDVVEVHSAQYAAPLMQWINADPADIWYELLTSHLGIPPERIGYAGTGQGQRSGLPPRVTERAPGDLTTQAKMTVSLRVQEEQDGDRLVDQVSFLMGGCTVAIGGQIVFRQIYPLRDGLDRVSVPTARPEVVFDPRDYTQLQTPTGVEQRATVCACDYGVNSVVESSDQKPTLTVEFVDADALAYLAPQDVEGLGRTVIPRDIARWCYNSTDQGLFDATQLAKQIVRMGSTGLRVWSWVSPTAHPELHVGDSVWLVTDQYTDFDPTRQITIRGWWAFELVIIGVQGGGRRFRAVLPSLASAIQTKGGNGTLPDDPSAPGSKPPTARILRVSWSTSQERIQLEGELGGAGPLEWQYSQDGGPFSGWSAAPLPQQIDVTRRAYFPVAVVLQTRQGDGQITTTTPFLVQRRGDTFGGHFRGLLAHDWLRGGLGGVHTPLGLIPTDPVYSQDGTVALVDTVIRSITTNLLDQTGRPIDSSLRNRARLRRAASQNFANLASADILWDTEDADIGGLHSLVANQERVTIPLGGNVGIWLVHARIIVAANGTSAPTLTCTLNHSVAGQLDFDIKNAYVSNFGFLRMFALLPAPAVSSFFSVNLSTLFTGAGPVQVTGVLEAFHLF